MAGKTIDLMRSLRAASLSALTLLAACSDPASPATDASLADVIATDTPATDVIATDVIATDVIATDVIATDVIATDTPATDVPATSDGGTDRARLEGLVSEVSNALCATLFRCCDAGSRARFFAPMRSDPALTALSGRIPADGNLASSMCPALLAEVYEIKPVGSWVRAALAGRVAFRASEADACLQRLSTAACGADAAAALLDGTCFGFSPPVGGAQQRRAFARAAVDGPCAALADGAGGGFYGTCDPTRAFCCGGTSDACRPVGTGAGTCRPASQVGETCTVNPSLRVCATGLECDSATGRCGASSSAPLAVGDTCAMGFNLLGECQDSYCDLGGTSRCVALAADGAMCTLPFECRSGACSGGRCVAETFCRRP